MKKVIPQKNKHLELYHGWQTWIAMGINIALFSRAKQLKNAAEVFDFNLMQKMGLIKYHKKMGLIACYFNDDNDSLLRFIQKRLDVDFYGALDWALDFIERTPPDTEENNDCRCAEGECEH